ncbi:MAG: hypothetical protein QOI27_2826 [Gaiellaceae bacterium]|nr:hypothetical protein [Gaiellaceae bacterium]MDX6468877.1 hypothetical protein [Gaiellaceae bacterium]MDX6471259.1 hypothetical protein [Gaiellaceae bacterium]
MRPLGRTRTVAVLTVVLAATACGTGAGSTPPAATLAALHVSPGGSDTASCTASAPCATVGRAYGLAKPGQIVELAAGTYPGQTVNDAGHTTGPNVIVRPASGATVSFSARLTISGASYLTLEGLRLAQVGPGDRSLFFDACTHDVTVRNVVGTTFLILEGNTRITFLGGSWGGYGTPGQEDSAIGTAGPAGPERMCNGQLAPPAHAILFDGVTFHDVFWGVPESDWGGSHPDCVEFNGYVDGVIVRNSLFLRCASTFTELNPDQGDITNVTFTNNRYEQLGPDTWYGIQIQGTGPHGCGNITFSHNTYAPGNEQAHTWPNGPLLTACVTVPGAAPVAVTRNLFVRGPPDNECGRYLGQPYGANWSDNLFLSSPCGPGRDVPFGYVFAGTALTAVRPAADTVRAAFTAAAGGLAPAAVARALARARRAPPPGVRWTAESVRALLRDPVYAGGAYGAPGADPPLVTTATWRRAQRALVR